MVRHGGWELYGCRRISGFKGTYDKLLQVEWQPEMSTLGNNGDHLDYFLSVPWIREYVGSWVAPNP